MVIVLTLALLSLPLKFLVLDTGAKKAPAPTPAPPKEGAAFLEERRFATKKVKQQVQELLD